MVCFEKLAQSVKSRRVRKTKQSIYIIHRKRERVLRLQIDLLSGRVQ